MSTRCAVVTSVGHERTRAEKPAPRSRVTGDAPSCGDDRAMLLTTPDGSVRAVPVLFATHEAYLDHLPGPGHPERPARLAAVLEGARDAAVADALIRIEPRMATRTELERVHPASYIDRISKICEDGGGRIDADTTVSPGSWKAACLGAGAGLAAVEALQAGTTGAAAAFCAIRPPGHHATPTQSMGFCVVNNVAVVAAHLAAAGERVVIVDYDAHHGNGTQDAFYSDPRVLYISLHQWPLYPGTGHYREVGEGDGWGTTVNLPMPPNATGDTYLAAVDLVVAPAVERFSPTWMIISAGFDAHRLDPITDLGLSAGDYSDLTSRLANMVPAGRRLVMLEGGYDLDALRMSTAAALGALEGIRHIPEPPTNGGPGMSTVEAVQRFRVESDLA
jgi:acetoin utilization deacetylase AcuC-like enzyme